MNGPVASEDFFRSRPFMGIFPQAPPDRDAHDFRLGPFRPRSHRRQFAAAHDADRVAQAEQLGQIGADDDHRAPAGGEAADQFTVNLAPCCPRRSRAWSSSSKRMRAGCSSRRASATFC